MLTPRVQQLLMALTPQRAAEQRLLTSRLDLWWQHYARYCERHAAVVERLVRERGQRGQHDTDTDSNTGRHTE